MVVIGVALGLLIGILSGVVALVLLKTANTASIKDASSLVSVTSELLAIAAFWGGGVWISKGLFRSVSQEQILPPYVIALLLSFTLIVSYPIFRWVISLGTELSRSNQEVKDA